MKIIICALMGFTLFARDIQTFKGIEKLEIKNNTGVINIQNSKGSQTKVITEIVSNTKGCRVEILNEDGTLKVKSKGKKQRGMCEVNIKAYLPKNKDIEIKNGYGNLVIKGNFKEIESKLGNGNLNYRGSFSSLKGDVGAGNTRINAKAGEIDLKVGMGNIVIDQHHKNLKGDFNLKTGKGNATVNLYAQSKFNVDFTSALGKINNDFGDAIKGDHNIRYKTGMGNFIINKK